MGVCQGVDSRDNKISKLEMLFPKYHDKNAIKNIGNPTTEEKWEHYIKFIQKKEDLSKENPELYSLFFDDKYKKEEDFKFEGLHSDDEERFHYFFNQCKYKTIVLKRSNIIFPHFEYKVYPEIKTLTNTISTLTEISIISSKIMFDEQIFLFQKIENVNKLNLSFDNIDRLPKALGELKKLTHLTLRRNNLKSLPSSFTKLKKLKELDLSENLFRSLPKEIFEESRDDLEKLNLNANLIEVFEYVGEKNNSLKILFLAKNKLTKIPLSIKKFTKLEFVNLDENKIEEIPHNLDEELPIKINISLAKNIGNFDDRMRVREKEGEKLRHRKNGKIESEDKGKKEQQTEKKDKTDKKKKVQEFEKEFELNENEENKFNSIKEENKEQNENEDNNCNKEENEEENENENNTKITITKKGIENPEKRNSSQQSKENSSNNQNQFNLEMDYIKKLVESGKDMDNESDPKNIEEEFRKLDKYKKYYNKIRDWETTGEKPKLDILEKNYFEQQHKNGKEEDIDENIKEKTKKQKQREDVSNLKFIKKLNLLITSNKIKVFLQYLGNIDQKIKQNVLNLIETKDSNSFVLFLTELKLLLQEVTKKYKEVQFDVNDEDEEKSKEISFQPKSVYQNLFNDQIARKILEQLMHFKKNEEENKILLTDNEDKRERALQIKKAIRNEFFDENSKKVLEKLSDDLKNEKKDTNENKQKYYTLIITEKNYNKQSQFENFLERFINLIKDSNGAPLII